LTRAEFLQERESQIFRMTARKVPSSRGSKVDARHGVDRRSRRRDMRRHMTNREKRSLRADIASRKHNLVREEILASAAKLFSQLGYRAVSMDDIASSLGYTKSILYYYFSNKNEILWQIYLRSFEKYAGDVQAVLHAKLPIDVTLKSMIRQHAL